MIKFVTRTHGFLVEVEHGRAEIFLALGQDLIGGRTGVRWGRVIERGYFRNIAAIFLEWDLFLGCLREAALQSQRFSSRYYPSGYESLHFFFWFLFAASLRKPLSLSSGFTFFIVCWFRKCRTGFCGGGGVVNIYCTQGKRESQKERARVVELERKRRRVFFGKFREGGSLYREKWCSRRRCYDVWCFGLLALVPGIRKYKIYLDIYLFLHLSHKNTKPTFWTELPLALFIATTNHDEFSQRWGPSAN